MFTPTTSVIAPDELVSAMNLAPTKGAYPRPGVEPRDTI